MFPGNHKRLDRILATLVLVVPITVSAELSKEPIPVTASFPTEYGCRLWLRSEPLQDVTLANAYRARRTSIHLPGTDPTLIAARAELLNGLTGLLGATNTTDAPWQSGVLLAGTPTSNPAIAAPKLPLPGLGRDGFISREIQNARGAMLVVAGEHPLGVLYDSFALLRHIQTGRPIPTSEIRSQPATQ